MSYMFAASGHPNITAKHKTTVEFTRDRHITKKGDCIIAVDTNFNLPKLKKFLSKPKVKITITSNNIKETLIAEPNSKFSDEKEMVIRTTDFVSHRTFAINADKAACDLKKELIKSLKDPQSKVRITIT